MGVRDLLRRTSPESDPEAGVREKIGDGFRGRPDVDLADYAAARGLDQRGGMTQLGYLAAMPLSQELQFNVLRGRLPGGEEGIVYHEVKVLVEGRGGTFYGVRGKSPKSKGPLDMLGRLTINAEHTMFKVPHTTVAVRVPEAQGALVGFTAGRGKDGGLTGGGTKVGFAIGGSKSLASGPGHWSGRKLDDRGLDGWQFATRVRGDETALEQVLDGPLQRLLAEEQPPRFRIHFRFGVLWMTQQQFAKRDAELDDLCRKASTLAAEMRRIAELSSRRRDFDDRLEQPYWAEQWRAKPKDTFVGGDGQDLGGAAKLADERGLELEDAFEFARGFSDLGWPGEPYVVGRGELAGRRPGRLVFTLGRKATSTDLNRYLEEKVAGPYGCNVAVIPLRGGVADTPGEQVLWTEGNGAYTVRRGILSAWQRRPNNTPDGAEVDELISGAVELADSLG